MYEVPEPGYFRIKRASQAQVQAAQQGLVGQLLARQDSLRGLGSDSSQVVPRTFRGTLGQALSRYDSLVSGLPTSSTVGLPLATRQGLLQYSSAIEQGTKVLQASFEQVYGGSREGAVVAVRDSLASLLATVQTTLGGLQGDTTGSGVALKLPLLAARYGALFDQLTQLTSPATSGNSLNTTSLSPVVLSNLTDSGVKLSWSGDPAISRYVVHYQLEGAGELQQAVSGSSLQLLNLKPGSTYTYTIEAYQGTQLVNSYQASFNTLPKTIPAPQNLAYSVVDEHTVTLRWDNNRLYQRFKLVYTDQNGIERTVYPSTNQYKLTDLDPAQHYTYQVVAYSSDNLVSDPSGGRLASGPACNLAVEDRNATNWASVPPNQHLLLATGCEGGQLSWTNGTAGTVTGNTITWADGETGQLGGLFLGDHALVVTPRKNTTYTAICRMGTGSSQKSCTYSVDVKVSSPECTGEFQISASATTFQKGDVVTLTASGCSGQLTWGQGLGSDPTVRLVPTDNTLVSAICTMGSTTCYANPIQLTRQPSCLQSLYLDQFEYNRVGGFLGIGTHISKDVKVYYLGCEAGTVTWSHTGAMRRADVMDGYYWLQDIQEPFTVSASCSGQDGQCAPVTLTFDDACFRSYSLSTSIDPPYQLPAKAGYLALYALTSEETNKMLLFDDTGVQINTQPSRGVYVPVSAKDKVYKAVFPPGNCTAYLKVPGRVSTPPAIQWSEQVNKGTATNVGGLFSSVTDAFDLQSYSGYNANYRLLMRVANCPGTMVWTHNQDPTFQLAVNRLDLSASNSPSVVAGDVAYLTFPTVTTTYYATCTLTNPDGSQEIFQATHPKTILITSDNCMRIDVGTASVTKGNPVHLTAIGCTGEVSWSAGGQVAGVGPSLTHTPVPATTPSAYVYTATCSDPACDQSVSVQIKPCQFIVAPATKAVKIAEAVTLTASGCEGGLVQWSTGETGTSLIVKPLEATTYTATCLVDGASACSNSAQITVDNKRPDDVECPPFELTSTTQAVVRCSNQPVTITPQGCPAGSTITWSDGHTSGPTEALKLTLNQGITLTATCTTPYQIQVTQTLTIGVAEPQLEVSPTEVYAGFPAMLRASGCYTSDCREGTYTWSSQGKTVGTGNHIVVTLLAETTYTVTCNGKTSATKTIKLKEGDCDKGFQVDNKSGNISTSQYYISASWCDANYAIRWTKKTRQGDQYVTQDYPAGSGKRRFTVNRPPLYQFYLNGQPFGDPQPDQDVYTVYCVRNGTPCMYSEWVVISYDPGFPDLPGSYISGGPAEAPSSPGPCNESVGMEKAAIKNLTFSPGDDQSSGSYYVLYTDWCRGTVVWTDSKGAVVSSLTVGPFTSAPTYHFTCTLSSGGVCEGDYQLPPPENMGGRLAAPVPTVSTPVANNCSNSLDLSVGLSVFYEQMLCQLSLLGKTRDEIQAELVSLEQKMSGLLVNSASATTIEFPSDLNPVIDDLLAGQCKQAAGLLAAPNKNIQIFNTDFNALINNQFEDIEHTIATNLNFPFSIHLQAFAPFSTFGFGFEGDGDNRKIGNSRTRYRLYSWTGLEYHGTSFNFTSKGGPPSTSSWFGRNAQQSETVSFVDFFQSSIPRNANLHVIAKAGNDATMLKDINDYLEKHYQQDIGDISDMNIDRDLTVSLSMTDLSLQSKVLTLRGEVQGEFFPTTDLFIVDKAGTQVTLGGAAAKVNMANTPCNVCGCEAKDCGPFAHLGKPIYKNFDYSISIKVENGLFKKVIDSSGKEWEIRDWNQAWLNEPTVIVIPK